MLPSEASPTYKGPLLRIGFTGLGSLVWKGGTWESLMFKRSILCMRGVQTCYVGRHPPLLPLDCWWIFARGFNMVESVFDRPFTSCNCLMRLREKLV